MKQLMLTPIYKLMNHFIWIWTAKFGVKCIDCGWNFHAYCVIPCNNNLLDSEKETFRSFRTSRDFSPVTWKSDFHT